MPNFWDRQVVFFANLYEIFYENREKTEALAGEVGPSRSYGGRFLPALNLLYRGSGNILVLEEAPSVALCEYFQNDLDLSLPEVQILPARDYRSIGEPDETAAAREIIARLQEELGGARSSHHQWVDGFVTEPGLIEIARRLGLPTTTTQEASRRGNNKLLIFEHFRDAGWPVIPTELAPSPAAVAGCLDILGRQGFTHAVVKSQMGASGIGLQKLRIQTDRDLLLPDYFFTEGPVMVQGWLQPGERGISETRSPSVQFFLADDRATVFDITEQLLTGKILHAGNQAPPPYLVAEPELRDVLLEQSRVAIRWLHAQGYRGFGGLDFIVAEHRNRTAPEVYLSEINARVTAATYPSILVRHLDPGARWTMRNIDLFDGESEAEIVRRLDRAGHLFLPGKPGIIPLNFSSPAGGAPGKGQFLGIGEAGSWLLEHAFSRTALMRA